MREAILVAALMLAPQVAPTAWASEELATKHDCFQCHDIEHKKVGPAFRDVAARYRYYGDPNAPLWLAKAIRGGTRYTWGGISMPGHPSVNEADAKTLAEWILSLPVE
jgi:cytochrome c